MGPSGSGKSYLIKQISELLEGITYIEINLAKLDRDEFCLRIKNISLDKPTLCFIDEVDSKPSEYWPYEILLTYLDPPASLKKTCFVLAGSSGKNISEMEKKISSRQKGPDLLSR